MLKNIYVYIGYQEKLNREFEKSVKAKMVFDRLFCVYGIVKGGENMENYAIFEETTKKEETDYVAAAMTLYLKDIAGIGILSAKEEVELAKTMEKGGEEALKARDALIKANLRFVMYCAKQYLGRGVELEDLNALGIEGLMKAVDKFDYRRGYRFATYAVWSIKQSITRGIDKNVTTESNTISLEKKMGEDKDSSLEEIIEDERAKNPYDYVAEKEKGEVLKRVLSQLDEKEALVLRLHYGIGIKEPMTLEEIGKLPQMGVTKERVRQIEKKAIAKIRKTSVWLNELREVAYER